MTRGPVGVIAAQTIAFGRFPFCSTAQPGKGQPWNADSRTMCGVATAAILVVPERDYAANAFIITWICDNFQPVVFRIRWKGLTTAVSKGLRNWSARGQHDCPRDRCDHGVSGCRAEVLTEYRLGCAGQVPGVGRVYHGDSQSGSRKSPPSSPGGVTLICF